MIDFSKAPRGMTHYTGHEGNIAWLKFINGYYYVYDSKECKISDSPLLPFIAKKTLILPIPLNDNKENEQMKYKAKLRNGDIDMVVGDDIEVTIEDGCIILSNIIAVLAVYPIKEVIKINKVEDK